MSSCQLCGNFFLSVGSEVVYTEMAVPKLKWDLSMLNFILWTNPKSSLTVFFLGTFTIQRDYILQETASFQKTYGLTTLTAPHPSLGIGLNFTLWTNPKFLPCSFLYRDLCNTETLYPAGNCQLSKMYGLKSDCSTPKFRHRPDEGSRPLG
jgi:hypothetical protein